MQEPDEDPYYRLRPRPPTPADEVCSCAPAGPMMLMSALGENPIHCLACNREVEPASIPLPAELVDTVAHWSWITGAINALELDSGPYEMWAQSELLDLGSAVNREGLELRRLLDDLRRCYFVVFQRMDVESGAFVVPDACPSCDGPLTGYTPHPHLPRLLCDACSLVLVNP